MLNMTNYDGLHMHGFPDRTTLRIDRSDLAQDLRGTSLTRLVDVQRIRFTPNLLAHSAFIDEHAAKPEVGLCVLLVIGIHSHRQALETFLITLINCGLLWKLKIFCALQKFTKEQR